MITINRIVLIGRLTRDPELRFTASGKAVATFNIAVNRLFSKEKEADFFNIVVWGKTAENCANYLAKGRLVGLEGRLQNRTYETQAGEKRYVTEIVADNVEFLEWGDKANNNSTNNIDRSIDIDISEFTAMDDDEDIPFLDEQMFFRRHKGGARLLGQLNIDGQDKIQVAIERFRMFEPPEGYYLAFSGGKDSLCIYHLAKMAGVKFDAHYNHTTVDPPELVRFIRTFKDVEIDYPEKSMWQLIVEKRMPPTRIARYCCSALKEGGGTGRFVVTGVRWAESVKRKNTRNVVEYDVYGSKSKKAIKDREIFLNSDNDEKRRMIENCQTKSKNVLNPIVDWTEADVWSFIKKYNLEYCTLYDEGLKRLGCVGCPMSGKRGMKRDFKKWPKYQANYIRAFDRMVTKRLADGLETQWKSGEEVFEWWLGNHK